MPRHVALLRGVNVGGVKLAMADLRAVLSSLGYAEVSTYIQSGNALFSADAGGPGRRGPRTSRRRWTSSWACGPGCWC